MSPSSSNKSYSKKTSGGSHQQTTTHQSSESFSSTAGGLLSGGSEIPEFTSSFTSNNTLESSAADELEQAQNAVKEREAQLDEREAELKKKQENLAEREDALDAAHERLIGAETEDEDAGDKAKGIIDPSSAALVDELRKENESLRSELAAAKQKKPARFLTQRFAGDDISGSDRFKLSERKSGAGGGGGGGRGRGGLSMGMGSGFDPHLMDRWRAGHQMMGPKKPRPDSSRPDGK